MPQRNVLVDTLLRLGDLVSVRAPGLLAAQIWLGVGYARLRFAIPVAVQRVQSPGRFSDYDFRRADARR